MQTLVSTKVTTHSVHSKTDELTRGVGVLCARMIVTQHFAILAFKLVVYRKSTR